MSYLGRGFEDTPGKPFGWAFNRETEEIEAHLLKRGWSRGDLRFYFRVTRIRERLWRNRPTFKERQAAWRARQPAPTSAGVTLSIEELERLVELFEGANDPVTASIGAKAAEALARLKG